MITGEHEHTCTTQMPQLLIDTFGWQSALLYLAFFIWVAGIPLSFLFYDRPEDLGLSPDGKPAGNLTGAQNGSGRETRNGTLKTRIRIVLSRYPKLLRVIRKLLIRP